MIGAARAESQRLTDTCTGSRQKAEHTLCDLRAGNVRAGRRSGRQQPGKGPWGQGYGEASTLPGGVHNIPTGYVGSSSFISTRINVCPSIIQPFVFLYFQTASCIPFFLKTFTVYFHLLLFHFISDSFFFLTCFTIFPKLTLSSSSEFIHFPVPLLTFFSQTANAVTCAYLPRAEPGLQPRQPDPSQGRPPKGPKNPH